MASFFADVDEAEHFKVGTNDLPTARPPEIEVLSRREREVLAAMERELAEIKASDSGTAAIHDDRIAELEAGESLQNLIDVGCGRPRLDERDALVSISKVQCFPTLDWTGTVPNEENFKAAEVDSLLDAAATCDDLSHSLAGSVVVVPGSIRIGRGDVELGGDELVTVVPLHLR